MTFLQAKFVKTSKQNFVMFFVTFKSQDRIHDEDTMLAECDVFLERRCSKIFKVTFHLIKKTDLRPQRHTHLVKMD